MQRLMVASTALASLLAAGCARELTGPNAGELTLARDAQLIADQVSATAGGVTHDGWVRRLLEALSRTDDPEARALLEQARQYRVQAREALAAGDTAEARRLHELAFRSVLGAVIEVFPNSPARTGAAVDQAVARIEERLGDREAPRIRRVLAHVRELRNQADRALAGGDAVTALALNLRGMQILHRLVGHLRHRTDGRPDPVADGQMREVGY